MIHFWVSGRPSPGGSKRYVGHSKAGRAILLDMGGKHTKDWRSAVAAAARVAYRGVPLDCAVRLKIVFHMQRPKSHYDRHGLREDAPSWHLNAPDGTKLTRSTEDALKGIIWTDDSRVAVQHIEKRYADGETHDAQMTGCYIVVEVL